MYSKGPGGDRATFCFPPPRARSAFLLEAKTAPKLPVRAPCVVVAPFRLEGSSGAGFGEVAKKPETASI
jgi:hypothetical protein